jgi:hypothetical protein
VNNLARRPHHNDVYVATRVCLVRAVTFTSSDPSPTSRAPSMGRHTVEDLEPGRNDRPGRAARGEDGDRRMEGRRKGRGNFNAAFATRLSRLLD